jgi:hypothetical protein
MSLLLLPQRRFQTCATRYIRLTIDDLVMKNSGESRWYEENSFRNTAGNAKGIPLPQPIKTS